MITSDDMMAWRDDAMAPVDVTTWGPVMTWDELLEHMDQTES